MKSSLFSLVLSLALLAVDASLTCGQQLLSYSDTNSGSKAVSNTTDAQGNDKNADPCALLASAYAQQIAEDPSATGWYYPPSMVRACLITVPMETQMALDFTAYVKNFSQFQSTLPYLKNPPSSYDLPAVDILGGLDAISKNVTQGVYQNWLDFELSINQLVDSANDGHFHVWPPLATSFFFTTFVKFVSVSVDGKAAPGVYFLTDFQEADPSFEPSDVIAIDGEDVNAVLLNLAAGSQDLDALYNSMFWNQVGTVGQSPKGGYWSPGSAFNIYADTTEYTFRNGTKLTVTNAALSKVPLDSIASGQDLFDMLVAPQPTKTDSDPEPEPTPSGTKVKRVEAPYSSQQADAMSAAGYPQPVFISDDNSISGYFLSGSKNTAVLSIRGFTNSDADPVPGNIGADFQAVITNFLAACSKNGKTRIIIDVRGNPGGAVFTGYDAFKQFFPTKQIVSKERMRMHPAAEAMGYIFSQFPQLSTMEELAAQTDPNSPLFLMSRAGDNSFNAHDWLKSPDGDRFATWNEFQPVTDQGDSFSNFFAIDFANGILDLAGNGIVVSGYQNRTNVAAQVFQPQDIVILSDGFCASTCTIFSNLMLNSGNVKSITIGGRPQNNKMSVIGGVAGSQEWGWENLASFALIATALAENMTLPTDAASTANFEAMVALIQDPPINFNLKRGGVNFLNNHALSDSNIPLQFLDLKTADCRMYNMLDDYISVEATWERIASGQYDCIDGGKKW